MVAALVVLVVGALAVPRFLFARHHIGLGAYDQIQEGMTEAEVEALIGCGSGRAFFSCGPAAHDVPGEALPFGSGMRLRYPPRTGRAKLWGTEDRQIIVWFDAEGRAWDKGWSGPVPEDPIKRAVKWVRTRLGL
jgi:hypothetical protein